MYKLHTLRANTPSTGLRHPSWRKVPESDARSVWSVASLSGWPDWRTRAGRLGLCIRELLRHGSDCSPALCSRRWEWTQLPRAAGTTRGKQASGCERSVSAGLVASTAVTLTRARMQGHTHTHTHTLSRHTHTHTHTHTYTHTHTHTHTYTHTHTDTYGTQRKHSDRVTVHASLSGCGKPVLAVCGRLALASV